jgi:threonine aldolase
MYRFNNDYSKGCHPAILEALGEINGESYAGYGMDEWCRKGAAAIKNAAAAPDADVWFMIGGTQTNMIMIDVALRSFEGVICADTGHINVHETGAVEYTGHKVISVPGTDGKISASQIEEQGELLRNNPTPGHIVEPKMVYISHPTELGTLYTLDELKAIRKACDRYGFYLYLDGARLNYALASETDVTLPDIAMYCDAFYCGGTKCGTLCGEALVIMNDELKPHFFSYRKQRGGLLAKGWLLGLQFYVLFRDGLYEKIGRTGVDAAMRIKHAFEEKGIDKYIDSPTNQQFFVLDKAQIEKLSRDFVFDEICDTEDGRKCMRFCTAWYTTEEEVDALVKAIYML